MASLPRSILDRIAAIEAGPGRGAMPPRLRTGWDAVDADGGGLPLSGVHEWFAHAEAVALPLGVLVHLAWRCLRLGRGGCPVAWVGRGVWPYPRVLVGGLRRRLRDGSGSADDGLLSQSVMVDASTPAERLWCADQCLRCRGIGCVVLDATGFSLPATRRLQLASSRGAGEPGVLALAARPWRDRTLLSAATTRWRVEPAPGTGAPAWRVEMLRWKGSGAAHGCLVRTDATWEGCGCPARTDAPGERCGG